MHIGGNRGRGQVYPTGDKSNNVIFTSSSAGTINSIETIEDGSYQINIENENGDIVTEAVPVGPKLIVKEQDQINAGDPLTNCLLYTSPSPRDGLLSRMPSSA